MKVIDIAREIFPNKTESFLDYVIWNETGFPSFWNIPEDGETPEACLRKQLNDLKNRIAKNNAPLLPESEDSCSLI